MRHLAIYLLTQLSSVSSLIRPSHVITRTHPLVRYQSTQRETSSCCKDTVCSTIDVEAQRIPSNVSRKGFLLILSAFTLVDLNTLPVQAAIKNTGSSSTTSTAGYLPDMVGGYKKPKGLGGLAGKVRSLGVILDELQRDLMQERWDLIERYPIQLRSYVPIFTTFTDSAFPTDAPTDKGLRVALRYEVGRFFASLERLRQATSRKSLDEAYLAYSEMSLHYDRYLHVGGLYTYYDATITNEDYFKGI